MRFELGEPRLFWILDHHAANAFPFINASLVFDRLIAGETVILYSRAPTPQPIIKIKPEKNGFARLYRLKGK